MPSHLSTIGLPVGTEAEFWDLAQRVGPLAAGVPVAAGTYFVWRDHGGAELWLQVTPDDQFVGMAPHFSGESRVPARLTRRVPRPDGGPFDGSFHALAVPDTDGGDGLYPFVFDSPEFLRLDPLPIPVDVTLQVAAFAHELEVFESEAHFAEVQDANADDNTPALAARFFAPAGMLAAAPGELPDARAVFTGVVVRSGERANGLSGRSFTWALVETHGGTFDIVADTVLAPTPPPVGGVVSGSFWLSARVRVD